MPSASQEDSSTPSCEKYKKIMMWILISGAVFVALLIIVILFWSVSKSGSLSSVQQKSSSSLSRNY